MSGFDEREKSFEAKYKREQETLFRVTSRRNRLLGLWAAEIFGMPENQALDYAKEVVLSDFEEPGDEDVVRKLLGDFEGRGIEMDEDALRKEMIRLMDEAGQSRSRYVRIADRAARLYAPAVHSLAAAAFIGWLVAGAGLLVDLSTHPPGSSR